MGVVNVKSSLIINRDAAPRVMNHVTLDGGRVRSKCGTVEITNGDSIASIFRLFSLPSNARLKRLTIYCDAVTSAAADFGLYDTTNNGAAVVAVGAYATAQSLASANIAGIEVAFEARNIDKINNRVWQDAGLSADPTKEFDVCATLTAAAAASGTLSFDAEYVVD